MNELTFTTAGSLIDECAIALEDHFNNFAPPPNNEVHRQKCACYARDKHGTVVAGILGEFYNDLFLIQGLWVSAKLRNSGVGSKLLQLMENHVATQNTLIIGIELQHSQALKFYLKNDYQLARSHPNGESYTLKKVLPPHENSG